MGVDRTWTWTWLGLLALVVACGGNATRKRAAESSSSDTASSSSGTSSSSSTSSGGTRGTTSSVETTSTTTTGSGGGSCDEVCDAPPCPDGDLVVPDGECCAVCSCAAVSCVTVDCGPEEISVRHPGACCPSCESIRGCETDDDCIVADRPRSCCGCPEVINKSALDEDPCWYDAQAPRDIPEECYPEEVCDAVCGACAPVGGATCFNDLCADIACVNDEACTP